MKRDLGRIDCGIDCEDVSSSKVQGVVSSSVPFSLGLCGAAGKGRGGVDQLVVDVLLLAVLHEADFLLPRCVCREPLLAICIETKDAASDQPNGGDDCGHGAAALEDEVPIP